MLLWHAAGNICSLCWSQEDIVFTLLAGTLESSVISWDCCRYYRYDDSCTQELIVLWSGGRGDMFILFCVNLGVRWKCAIILSLLGNLFAWTGFWAELWIRNIAGHLLAMSESLTDFTDDPVVFAASLEILLVALQTLPEKWKPLGLQVF